MLIDDERSGTAGTDVDAEYVNAGPPGSVCNRFQRVWWQTFWKSGSSLRGGFPHYQFRLDRNFAGILPVAFNAFE